MDPLPFARYYAGPSNPHFVKMVHDHNHQTCTCFDCGMKKNMVGKNRIVEQERYRKEDNGCI